MTISPWQPQPDESPARRIHMALVSASATASQALTHCDTVPEPDWVGPASGNWQAELDNLRTALRNLDSVLTGARTSAHRVWISELQN